AVRSASAAHSTCPSPSWLPPGPGSRLCRSSTPSDTRCAAYSSPVVVRPYRSSRPSHRASLPQGHALKVREAPASPTRSQILMYVDNLTVLPIGERLKTHHSPKEGPSMHNFLKTMRAKLNGEGRIVCLAYSRQYSL